MGAAIIVSQKENKNLGSERVRDGKHGSSPSTLFAAPLLSSAPHPCPQLPWRQRANRRFPVYLGFGCPLEALPQASPPLLRSPPRRRSAGAGTAGAAAAAPKWRRRLSGRRNTQYDPSHLSFFHFIQSFYSNMNCYQIRFFFVSMIVITAPFPFKFLHELCGFINH